MENKKERINGWERRKIREQLKEKYTNNTIPIINLIKQFLLSGDSIQVSVRKACGHQNNALARHIKKTPEYLTMLNWCMEHHGYKMRFYRHENGSIKQISNPGNETCSF